MKRVLVIDDDRPLLMELVAALDNLGFESLTAFNGAKGVEIAIAQQPDLILCDLCMPCVDGFETLWQIRQNEATAKIAFVICSGFIDETTLQKAMKLGANDVIRKPVSVPTLLATLNRHLQEAA